MSVAHKNSDMDEKENTIKCYLKGKLFVQFENDQL